MILFCKFQIRMWLGFLFMRDVWCCPRSGFSVKFAQSFFFLYFCASSKFQPRDTINPYVLSCRDKSELTIISYIISVVIYQIRGRYPFFFFCKYVSEICSAHCSFSRIYFPDWIEHKRSKAFSDLFQDMILDCSHKSHVFTFFYFPFLPLSGKWVGEASKKQILICGR